MPLNFDDANHFAGIDHGVKPKPWVDPVGAELAKAGIPRDLSTILEAEGAGHLRPVVQAIYGQESGEGANPSTSTDGARGGMQIMPGTFKQLARPGELIDNPDDNLRVGVRLIKQLGDKFNNDPARIAAGYFSGEGNVAPSGDLAYRTDHADGNGKRVSAYVQDVMGRLAPVDGKAIAQDIAGGGGFDGMALAREIAGGGGMAIAREIAGDEGQTPAPRASKPPAKLSTLEKLKQAVGWREGESFKAPEGTTDATFSAGIPSNTELSQRGGLDLIDTHGDGPKPTPMQRLKNWEIDQSRAMLVQMSPDAIQQRAAEDKHFAARVRLATERKVGPDAIHDRVTQPARPEPERPSMARLLALENPLTAAVEAGANFASQGLALPAAGIAGLAYETGNALGLTQKKGADVVHSVGDAFTYQPRGEMGKAAAGILAYPFEKLAEGGQWAGNKTLDATGSPLAATAIDTTINALPMLLGAGKSKGAKIGGLEAGGHSEASLQFLSKTHPDPTTRALAELELDARSRHAPRPVEPERVEPTLAREPEISEPLRQFADEVDPIPLEEAQQLLQQSQAAGSDALAVAPHPGGGGYLIAPREWLSEPMAVAKGVEAMPRAALEGLQPDAAARAQSLLPDATRGEVVTPDIASPDVGRPLAMAPGDVARPDAPRLAEAPDVLWRSVIDQTEQGVVENGRTLYPAVSVPGLAGEFRITSQGVQKLGAKSGLVGPASATETAALRRAVEADQAQVHLLSSWGGAAPEPVRVLHEPAGSAFEQRMAPGKNHVGLIDDSLITDTAPRRTEPLRRENILSDLAKSLDATVYQGRVKGKGVLGTYTPKKEVVRIKNAADIEVAGHEIAHLLDDRIPEIRQVYKSDKAIAKELRSVSYDQTKLHEGFAEFTRLWMTQPEVAAAKAPRFNQWFNEFVARHESGAALRKAQGDMTAWFGQDALDRARSKIGANKAINDAFDRASDKFRQSAIDDLHGIYRMERSLKGDIQPGGAYEASRLSRASQSLAEGAINLGAPVRKVGGDITFAGKGLREILEPVAGKLDDTLLYFVGRSAQELAMQGREHLFTPAEIKSMTELRTPERAAAFAEYQKWNAAVVDFAEAAGVINGASRKLWQRQSYMPFHRVGQPGGYSAKPGAWSGVKALTGGTENLRDILGNMTSNAATLIDKAIKNEARLKIAELAESERGGGKFMTRIDPESRPVRVDKAQALKALLESLGIDKSDPAMGKVIADLKRQIEQDPGMLELMMPGQPPAGSNVVAVLKNGKPTYYEVADPVLYRALSSIDRPTQSWLIKLLGLPKRVGQLATTLTLDFMVANIARDTLMGAVMSRAGFRPVMDSLTGMRLRMTNDPIYKEFIANGGGLSSIYLDEGKLRTRLEKFYRNERIDYRTVLDTPAKLLGFVETLADAFESSTRLGEYKRAREGGAHPRHAAYLAREVSTDFAMRGDHPAVNFMYDTVMFLKPAVLSFDRLARGLMHDPNRAAIAAKSSAVALFSVGLALLNGEDERYRDLPDWDKDTHWHFFVGDQHFRYPKIWEIGALASVAERAVEQTIEGDPGGLGKDLVRIIGQTFNLNLMPQILAPVFEQATNRNSFTKAAIETPDMASQQPFMRAKPTTSLTLQAAGMATRSLPESLQVNPVRTEALLRGYLSTWAMYGLALSDRAFFADEMPASRLDQMPVVRRFYSEDPPLHTKHEQQYYDMLGEARRLFGSMREAYKTGRQDLGDEFRDNPQLKEYGPLEGTGKMLSVLNAKMRAIRRDDTLDPDEKRAQLDEWTRKRNELLKKTVEGVEAARVE